MPPTATRADRPEDGGSVADATECAGERIPCWDAQRRVGQALDLLLRQPRETARPLTAPLPDTPATRPLQRRCG